MFYRKANIYGSTQHLNSIRENREFHCHVLRVTRDFIRDFSTQPEYKHVTHSRRLFMLLCTSSKILFEHCVKKLIPIMERFDVEAAMLGVESFKQCLITANSVYGRKLSEFLRFVTNENQSITENIIILTRTIEELLLKCLEEKTLFDIDANSRQIPGILLSCLEMLYSHIPPERQEARKVFEWLHEFCEKHSIVGKGLDNVHKMLLQQYLKTDEGIFLNSVAAQLSIVMGTFSNEIENPTPSNLKSIEEGNAESCYMNLIQVLRKELTDVEYLILKLKSILAKLKIMGTTSADEHIEPLIAMEKAVCMHLIKVANCILSLTNIKINLGAPVEGILRLIVSYFVAVTNVTKHFTARHPLIPVNYSVVHFDKLVRITGKFLSRASYGLIKFIYDLLGPKNDEDTSTADRKKKESIAVVVRNTRYLSTVIREMENFNKFVRMLGRKMKNKGLEKYLHEDCVRDFRIKADAMKDALEDEIEECSSEEEDIIDALSDEDRASPEIYPTGGSGASTVHDIIPESDHEDAIQRNVKRVRSKAKKKTSESEADESPNKASRKPKAPLKKLNKRAAGIVVKTTRKHPEDTDNPPKRAKKSK